MSLKRPELEYMVRAKEALIHAQEAHIRNEVAYSRQLINDFIFSDKNNQIRLTATQEIELVLIIIDLFRIDDAGRLPFFFTIFCDIKNKSSMSSRKNVLLKLILTAIALPSPSVSNLPVQSRLI